MRQQQFSGHCCWHLLENSMACTQKRFCFLARSVLTRTALQRTPMKGGTPNVVFVLYKQEVSWELKHNKETVCVYVRPVTGVQTETH